MLWHIAIWMFGLCKEEKCMAFPSSAQEGIEQMTSVCTEQFALLHRVWLCNEVQQSKCAKDKWADVLFLRLIKWNAAVAYLHFCTTNMRYES